MRLRDLLVLGSTLAFFGCAGVSDGSDEEDLTSDAKMTSLVTASQKVVYANITSKASKPLADALIAANDRGVEVHVLLEAGAHDTTWMLQQRLESNGVDVDVRDDAGIAGVKLVVDAKALVGTKTVTKAATVQGFVEKFTHAMEGDEPAKAALLASGVAVHPMPESSRDRIVGLFDAATTSIDLEIYQLQEPRVVRALEEAASRGVTVRVMLEPKTVGGRNFDAVSKKLGSAGVTVHTTPTKFDSSHNVDHAKFCVIDGRELLFGTGNLVRSGLGGVTDDVYANRDFWVEDARAASVKEAQKLFAADWAQTPTSASDYKNLVLTPDNADARIVALVDGAKTRLYVENQSLDDDDLVARLIAAKHRGVDVHVLLGYQPGFGGPPKNQAPIDKLVAEGIEAEFLKSHYLHAKAIVADDAVYLGSQNFTNGGLHTNREVGEILTDATAVSAVLETIRADLANP